MCSKPFKSKAAGLHHCIYLPSTAKTSAALGLLRLHHHGPRKPPSFPRHPGEAAGCCRQVLAHRAACPGGDEPQEEVTATHCRLQAQLLLHETRLPTRKSSCSRCLATRLASVPISITVAAVFVTRNPNFKPKTDNTLNVLASRTSADPHPQLLSH